MGRKNHTHRTVTLISKNRNSIGKWEMWMRSPELMNRYDGVNFLRCLTHTTTYCVSVLNSLSSRCQRSEVVTWAAAGGEGSLGRRLVSALCHTSFLCVRVQTPLFSLVRSQDKPPSPPALRHLDSRVPHRPVSHWVLSVLDSEHQRPLGTRPSTAMIYTGLIPELPGDKHPGLPAGGRSHPAPAGHLPKRRVLEPLREQYGPHTARESMPDPPKAIPVGCLTPHLPSGSTATPGKQWVRTA